MQENFSTTELYTWKLALGARMRDSERDPKRGKNLGGRRQESSQGEQQGLLIEEPLLFSLGTNINPKGIIRLCHQFHKNII